MPAFDLFSIGSWAPFDHIFKMARYPQNGDTVALDMPVERVQKYYYGDCSANIAAVAGRLGLKAGLGMVVGEDFDASGYRDHLSGLGVDLSGVEVVSGKASGHNYLFFDARGDGFCISHLGLAARQADWQAPLDLIRSSRYVVINEMFSNYTLQAARMAHASGATVAINGMVGTAGGLAEEFIRNADILFIAQKELSNLLALLKLDHPQHLFDLGLSLLFATQGAKGSRVVRRDDSTDVPIVKVNDVIDPTGAGDSYTAGTLAGLIKGFEPGVAAQMGATVSSFIIQDWGCQTNLPTWDQVLERHQRQNWEITDT